MTAAAHGSGARWRRRRAAERGASTAAAHGSGARWRRAAERGASTWGGGAAAAEVEAAEGGSEWRKKERAGA